MTPHDLLANFEVLAEAPNGIQRLRELVLELAVRGNLVEQDAADEPAKELIERVWTQRKATSSARRANHSLPPEAAPYDLPQNWAWARFDEIASIDSNLVDPSKYPSLPHIAPDNIEKHTGRLLPYRTVSEDGIRSSNHRFRSGHILYSKIRPNLSKAVVVDFAGLCSADMYPLSTWLDRGYFHRFLLSHPFLIQVTTGDNRVAMPKVNQQQLSSVLVPVPPHSEQGRINARVDELMALLDRLEAKRQEREAARAAARDSALAALRDAATPDGAEIEWLRVQDRFGELFATTEDVEPLRQTILQLATNGRLVPQDPTDPSGARLLEQIAAVKSKASSARKRRRSTSEQPAVEINTPSQAPKGWSWAELGDILSECRNGLSTTPNDSGEGIRHLRISAATSDANWVVNTSDHRWVVASDEQIEQYRIRAGDLLSCRFNGNLRFVGKVAQVPLIDEEPILYPDKLIRLRPILVDPGFLCLAVNGGASRTQIESFVATTAGNLGINGAQLQSIKIPIPPLPEQIRIRDTSKAMFSVCDQLAARLRQVVELREAFASAAVHHLEV